MNEHAPHHAKPPAATRDQPEDEARAFDDADRSARPGPQRIDTPDCAESDALADLFLGPTQAQTRAAAQAPAQPMAHGPAQQAPGRSQEGGPAPALRLTSSHAPARHAQFQPAPTPAAPGIAPGSVRIEGLLLGHLPVRASAWVRQYAAHRAASLGGPVALVRLSAGSLSIDLVGPGAEAALRDAPSVEAAVRALAPRARAWLFRVDEPSEPGLFGLGSIDDLTLLSGADDTAVVNSYRAIKSLAHRGAWDEDGSGPSLRVAWMGCDPERAAGAQNKLAGATEAFVQREIEEAGVIPRIEPSPGVSLYRGPTGLDAQELIDLVRLVLDDDDLESLPREDAQAPDPSHHHAPAARAEPDRTADGTPTPAPGESGAEHACGPGAGRMHVADRGSEPHPEPPGSDAPADDDPGGSCAELLGGLTPIEARAPDADRIELAHDDAGGLHLLARCCRRGETMSRMVEELTAASAWAIRHATLLSMAVPSLGAISPERPPTLHLLTDAPRDARPLLDAPVRIHALVSVRVGERSYTATTPLN